MLSEAKQNGGQSLGTHHHSVPDLLQFGHLAPVMGVCLCVCICHIGKYGIDRHSV